jgi:hypothetical protein
LTLVVRDDEVDESKLILEIAILVISDVSMNPITSTTLDRALGLLGELLVTREHPPQQFAVCGGSSLLALGLVSHTTKQDVDILARIEADRLVTPRPLPAWLRAAAEEVGRQLDLPRGWLNDEVADETLFRCGLPEGLPQRLTWKDYGPRLRIGYISRRDQIFLKLHAAVDRDGGRHLQDLLELRPTASELLDAARWTRTQDSSDGFRVLLGAMLQHLGHADLSARL